MEKDKNWDKIFPQNDKVSHQKVSFKNQAGIIPFDKLESFFKENLK